MIVVPDTHAIAWLFNGDGRLSVTARDLLEDPHVPLMLPLIVAAELHDLFQRGKIREPLKRITSQLRPAGGCELLPMLPAMLPLIPAGLDIHDSWIAGTIRWLTNNNPEGDFRLLTHDPQLHGLADLSVIW